MFSGIYWNQPVCLSVHVSLQLFVNVSVCIQNTSLCQSTGRGNKSHVVTALLLLSFSTQIYRICGSTVVCYPLLFEVTDFYMAQDISIVIDDLKVSVILNYAFYIFISHGYIYSLVFLPSFNFFI